MQDELSSGGFTTRRRHRPPPADPGAGARVPHLPTHPMGASATMRTTLRLMRTHTAPLPDDPAGARLLRGFRLLPALRGRWLASFQEFKLLGARRPFVGWENYQTVWNDARFWQVLRKHADHRLRHPGARLLPAYHRRAGLSTSSAWSSSRSSRKTVVYLPHLFSWVVVGGMWIYCSRPAAAS